MIVHIELLRQHSQLHFENETVTVQVELPFER